MLKTVVVLIFALGVFASNIANSRQEMSPAETEGLKIIRSMATSELDFSMKQHKYVALDQLVEAAPSASYKKQLKLENSFMGHLSTFDVMAIPSTDGKHFTLSVRSSSDGCVSSFFTDEAGIIYSGQPIDCAYKPSK